MTEQILKLINKGSGPYQLTKEQAGETYRAARKVKVQYTSFFTRKPRKAAK
jgi:hypothetical protein